MHLTLEGGKVFFRHREWEVESDWRKCLFPSNQGGLLAYQQSPSFGTKKANKQIRRLYIFGCDWKASRILKYKLSRFVEAQDSNWNYAVDMRRSLFPSRNSVPLVVFYFLPIPFCFAQLNINSFFFAQPSTSYYSFTHQNLRKKRRKKKQFAFFSSGLIHFFYLQLFSHLLFVLLLLTPNFDTSVF